MSLEQVGEDLKAFERRLTEIIAWNEIHQMTILKSFPHFYLKTFVITATVDFSPSSSYPAALRWRVVLLTVSLFVAIGACFWLGDPFTAEVSFLTSLRNHPYFSFSTLTMFVLFLFGIHRRVVAPSIFVHREEGIH